MKNESQMPKGPVAYVPLCILCLRPSTLTATFPLGAECLVLAFGLCGEHATTNSDVMMKLFEFAVAAISAGCNNGGSK